MVISWFKKASSLKLSQQNKGGTINNYITKKSTIFLGILASFYFCALATEDDSMNSYYSSSFLNSVGVEFNKYDRDYLSIELLKNYVLTKFKAQKSHREHLLSHKYTPDEIQKAITEVHEWMWYDIKEKAKIFFGVRDYESCMFEDVLFIGALHDIFINQGIKKRTKQEELLLILEGSCRYISYDC